MNVVTGVLDRNLIAGGCSSTGIGKKDARQAGQLEHQEIKGYEKLEQLMVIDQELIGRTLVPILLLIPKS